jgi:hypothetical protein
VFWISYEDLLKKYQHFDRTRIFGPEWHITQQWTSVHVPWSADYHSTKFSLTLQKESPIVIVLSQLDETYFAGLEGAYSFDLQFRVQRDGDDENDYLVRSHGNYAMNRSVSTDITLEAGTYSILMKITARPSSSCEIEDALPSYVESRREKLIQMGLSYDLAHAKGIIVETEKEKQEREEREKRRKARDRERLKKEMRERARKDWAKRKALHKRDKKWRAKKSRSDAQRMAQGRTLEEDENADSMDAANGSERGRWKEPLVIKSFSGELIEMPSRRPPAVVETPDAQQDSIATDVAGIAAEHPMSSPPGQDELPDNETAQDTEQDSVAADTSRDTYPTPASTSSTADNIVQPLSEVIATANAESDERKAEHEHECPPTPIIQINGVDAVTDVKPLPHHPPLASAEAHLSPTPAQPQTNGKLDSHPVLGSKQDEDDAKDTSETDSFPDFDYQTDLDMDSDLDSDRGKATRRRSRAPRDPSPKGLQDEDDNYREPWNAVCVVGLRVYSLVSGPDLTLEVVRPRIEDSDSDDEDEDDKKPETVLDRDDPAKGAAVGNSGTRELDDDSHIID